MQGYGCHGEDASVYIHLSPKAAYCLCSGSDLSTIELQRHFKTNAELFINTLYLILVPETQHAILAIAFLLYIAVLYSSLPRSPSSFGPIPIFLIVYFAAKWARGIKGPEARHSLFLTHSCSRPEYPFDMAMPAGYKPSPLGPHGSPRSSPFRRPESPASPSAVRQTSTTQVTQVTPFGSPTKASYATNNGRFGNPTTPTDTAESKTPRVRTPTAETTTMASPQPLRPGLKKTMSHGNAISHLQPAQVRQLREGFEVLDRDSDGVINREDVADMLNQLGLPSKPSDVSNFFPPSTPQTMTMAAFLNSLATMLASLSPQSELLSAFSAFDDDDSGQIDLAELRDALLHTAPEPGERPLTEAEVEKVIEGFTGRRAFNRNMQGGLGNRREVFRYQDFVNSIMGSNTTSEAASAEGSED
ncbi:hypothetical protein CFIO01_03359 [Colletotrichum fioriniae PJ7]|uniref:EF-hand domain-containing protein n=1 Tax=Colletotrichum fioriniae PJ7 TaxID=1445577 RepID=A0A010QFL3_9PEZI|nr:hypothetical protein CFIO01_03359 [Colletotrichum fioriniae PJ7]